MFAAGSKHLHYPSSSPFDQKFLYFVIGGAFSMKLKVDDIDDLPFSSNCDLYPPSDLVVLKTTIIYNDIGLTDPACTLEAGTAIEFGGKGSAGYSLKWADYDYPELYELCPDATGTFSKMTYVKLFGETMLVPPILLLDKPS